MPAETVPVVAAIVGAFATFILVVGGVSLWTFIPDRKSRDHRTAL